MNIVFNFSICSGGKQFATERSAGQLILWAAVAMRAGHHVTRISSLPSQWHSRYLPKTPSAVNEAEGADLYVCSSGFASCLTDKLPGNIPILGFQTEFSPSKYDRFAKQCALFVVLVSRPEDDQDGKYPAWPGSLDKLRQKCLTVPWMPYPTVMDQLHADRMIEPFLDDDLEAIRVRYSAKKERTFGFLGYGHDNFSGRKAIARDLMARDSRFEFKWGRTLSDTNVPGDEYLRWMAGCRATLNLSGVRWSCPRFIESVMIGTPLVVVKKGALGRFDPPITGENAILANDWADTKAMFAGLDRLGEIRAKADQAYVTGWSLRSQFLKAAAMATA